MRVKQMQRKSQKQKQNKVQIDFPVAKQIAETESEQNTNRFPGCLAISNRIPKALAVNFPTFCFIICEII
jgi:hypothetical protein